MSAKRKDKSLKATKKVIAPNARFVPPQSARKKLEMPSSSPTTVAVERVSPQAFARTKARRIDYMKTRVLADSLSLVHEVNMRIIQAAKAITVIGKEIK